MIYKKSISFHCDRLIVHVTFPEIQVTDRTLKHYKSKIICNSEEDFDKVFLSIIKPFGLDLADVMEWASDNNRLEILTEIRKWVEG